MLEIHLPQGRHEFAPGEVIEGEYSWRADAAPGEIELTLLFRTEGKGTQDVKYVDTQSFQTTDPAGKRPFRFELPDGPYTFDGVLISLRWVLTLISDDEHCEEVITVSPWVETLKLKEFKEPGVLDLLAEAQQQQQQ